MNTFRSILNIVLHGRSAGKILLATIFSFTFSITVILCTFGLMDGFDHLLKSGLRHSSGDILITSKKGFFEEDLKFDRIVSQIDPLVVAGIIQSEAFALRGEVSRGVLVRGVESEKFSLATGLKLEVSSGEVILGEELAKELKVSKGENLAFTFGKGNGSGNSLPSIEVFKVAGTVAHGIYQKDLRFAYFDKENLSEILGVGDKINLAVISKNKPQEPLKSLDQIEYETLLLKEELGSQYSVKPFWDEYDFLIEAVRVEKLSISLILQLIVVVAIFNIVAFVIYIMEKKSQEFFFLRTIGLPLKKLMNFWFILILGIWTLSCVGAYFLTIFFNWCLQNVSYLQIPGEIYVLSSLSISLSLNAYLIVYATSLLWILLASVIGYIRLKNRPLIQGLRQEFSA